MRTHHRLLKLPLALLLATVLVSSGIGSLVSADAVEQPTRGGTAHARGTDTVSKVLVFVVENHSLRQMRNRMPFTFGLAQTYGYADHYDAIRHPSLPNYLAMTGGSTYGVTDDAGPSANGTHEPSVFGQALAHGRTAKTYAESMPRHCATANDGRYAVRHNPWVYHLDERAQCRRHDVALGPLAGDVDAGALPNVGMVVPNTCHDAHDCSLRVADRWLRRKVNMVLAGSDFTSGRLAVVVTADEDDRNSGNRVLTVVAHRSLSGQVVSVPLTHYSLSKALSNVAGARPLGQARDARGLLGAFGLQTG